MKFGVRQCANIVFRAKQKTVIGTSTFNVGQPVLYIDTATTSSMEQASTSVYAQGGRGNARLLAWEGDKTLTFTVTDALISPVSLSMLSGAGLIKTSGAEVHVHATTAATMVVTGTGNSAVGQIDLTDALIEFGQINTSKTGDTQSAGNGGIYVDAGTDAPLFIIETEDDGSITGNIITSNATNGITYEVELDSNDNTKVKKAYLNIPQPKENNTTALTETNGSINVLVDYYVVKKSEKVSEIQLTPQDFAGFYYVEADTLFRSQATGIDMPANLTFPNVKIQSGFTISMAGTGDPSTFDFTMDAFPGYTYFDKTKQVLCVIQVVEDSLSATSEGHSVMLKNDGIEHSDIFDDSDLVDPTTI